VAGASPNPYQYVVEIPALRVVCFHPGWSGEDSQAVSHGNEKNPQTTYQIQKPIPRGFAHSGRNGVPMSPSTLFDMATLINAYDHLQKGGCPASDAREPGAA